MTSVRLELIRFDAGTQVRVAINEEVVTNYAERMTAGDKFPPVVLFHDGNDYYLGDGFHRALAARRNGLDGIPSDVRGGTKTDALWFALGANKANANGMTNEDRRHAVALALVEFNPDTGHGRTQQQIADQIGCAQSLVSKVKSQFISRDELPQRVAGRDGKSYPARIRDRSNRPERRAPGKLDKSREAVERRRAQMREMAEAGHTSRQIASAVGMSDESCRNTMRDAGIAVPADKVTGRLGRHDANRIIESMVIDAQNLTADVELIDFDSLDRTRIAGWLSALLAARESLGGFIRRLNKEQQKNGEAA